MGNTIENRLRTTENGIRNRIPNGNDAKKAGTEDRQSFKKDVQDTKDSVAVHYDQAADSKAGKKIGNFVDGMKKMEKAARDEATPEYDFRDLEKDTLKAGEKKHDVLTENGWEKDVTTNKNGDENISYSKEVDGEELQVDLGTDNSMFGVRWSKDGDKINPKSQEANEFREQLQEDGVEMNDKPVPPPLTKNPPAPEKPPALPEEIKEP
jgi:hypothetical protein